MRVKRRKEIARESKPKSNYLKTSFVSKENIRDSTANFIHLGEVNVKRHESRDPKTSTEVVASYKLQHCKKSPEEVQNLLLERLRTRTISSVPNRGDVDQRFESRMLATKDTFLWGTSSTRRLDDIELLETVPSKTTGSASELYRHMRMADSFSKVYRDPNFLEPEIEIQQEEKISRFIDSILETSDIESCTVGDIFKNVKEAFPTFNLTRAFIKKKILQSAAFT